MSRSDVEKGARAALEAAAKWVDSECDGRGVFMLAACDPAAIAEGVREVTDNEVLEQNYDEVICPNCTHQFRAIPVNVQEELAALRRDAERLDSGMIITRDRDEFGEDHQTLRLGLDLRADIDAAIAAERKE